jgi:arsenate reductase
MDILPDLRVAYPAGMNDPITLWHNPRCSKSREALALLRAQGVEPDIRDYQRTPPSVAELAGVLASLGLEPLQLIRTDETVWSDIGGDPSMLDRVALIEAMVAHPVLIQRPLALRGNRAVLGRPPERVLDLL